MELNEDKILDFLDGSLNGAEEEELLHRLAVSPERRTVLKQYLQLRELSAILAKRHNYVVPKLLTAQLFTNLSSNGYAGPMYHAATDTDSLRNSLEANIEQNAQHIITEKKGFRATSLVFSSVVSFIAGAFLVYMLISSPTATGSLATLANNTTPVQLSPTSNVSVPVVSQAKGSVTKHVEDVDAVVETSSPVDESAFTTAPSHVEFTPISNTVDLGGLPTALFVPEHEVHEQELTNIPAANIYTSDDILPTVNSESSTIADETVTRNIASATTQNWWDGAGLYSTLDNIRRLKGYFGLEEIPDTLPFIRRTTVSLRSGGGGAPQRKEDFTGSLIEFKLSADIADWIVAKVSFGQFMPYETEALSVGKNSDGLRLLKLEPVLQYKTVVGAELGLRLDIFGASFEAMGGFLTDLRNGLIPRAGIFTSLMLQDNLSLQMGVEGILYTHDIRPSLANKQAIFAPEKPILTNAMQENETAGFIGPALELAWHF